MNKEIEAKPQRMDALDYLLLELNKSDDNRINVVKAQIKAKFNVLQNNNHKLIRKINILSKMFINECVTNGIIDVMFEKLFDEYLDMKAEKGGDDNE